MTTADDDDVEGDDDRVVLPPAPDEFGWWMEDCPKAEEIWRGYARGDGGGGGRRPWLGDTPGREMACYLMCHRGNVLASFLAASSVADVPHDDADEALREVVRLLLDWRMNVGISPEHTEDGVVPGCDDDAMLLSDNALRLSRFVCEELIEVPRDVGMIPALALGGLVRCALGKGVAKEAGTGPAMVEKLT